MCLNKAIGDLLRPDSWKTAAEKGVGQATAPKTVKKPTTPKVDSITGAPSTLLDGTVDNPTTVAQDYAAANAVEGLAMKKRRGISGTIQNEGGAAGINPLMALLGNKQLFGN